MGGPEGPPFFCRVATVAHSPFKFFGIIFANDNTAAQLNEPYAPLTNNALTCVFGDYSLREPMSRDELGCE